MYEQNFQLTSRPFTSTPFVKHYYPAQTIQKSLASARMCIDRGSGPVVVIGADGTGKSLMLAMLEEQYRPQFSVINLACARVAARQELLQSILFELQMPYRNMSEGELRLSLMDYLKPSQACPNGVLLLVDEAQNLPIELLDEIRLITNYVRDGQPRVRLVMSGSQALEERLGDSKLASFNQRIAARCFLSNLSQAETADYVITHIDRAGGDGRQMFNDAALRAVHELSEGCPRFVNQLCDHAMILAATRGVDKFSEALVREAWADVQSLPGTMPHSPTLGTASSTEQVTNRGSQTDTKRDENWTVIEFGSLDDDGDCSIEEATVFEIGGGSAIAERIDSGLDENSSLENIDGSESVVEESIVEEPVAYADPFAEEFEDEEEVIDRYVPLIAAQNQASLRLTNEELRYLQPLDQVPEPDDWNESEAHDDREAVSDSSEIERNSDELLRSMDDAIANEETNCSQESTVSCETGDPSQTLRMADKNVPVAAVSFNPTNRHEDRPTSPADAKERQVLKKIIEEKNRVSALTFGSDVEKNDASPSSFQPDFDATSNQDQESTPSLGVHSEPADEGNGDEEKETSVSNLGDDRYGDDQDILVINRDETNYPQTKTRTTAVPFPATPVSTGQAKRIDYQQLFEQLRSMRNE